MPRVPSDKTITHRIELGLPERQKLDELLAAYKENNKIDGVTATLQAAGSALAGGGMLWAAAALAAYLAPGLIKQAYENTKDLAQKAVAPIVDPLVDSVTKELYDAVQEAGRKATEAKSRKERFCTPGINFDEEQCIIASNEYEAAKQQQKQAMENALGAVPEVKSQLGQLWDLVIPISPFYNPYDQ